MEERRDRFYRAEELSMIRESSIMRFKQIYESLPIDSLGRKIWNRAKDKDGYGLYSVSLLKGGQKQYRAHRLAYLIYVGDIPEGLFICHTTDTPSDVCVSNLYAGTNKQNQQDALLRNRVDIVKRDSILRENNFKGRQAAYAKRRFSDNTIREIRKLIEEKIPLAVIAEQFDTSVSNISLIKNKKRYSKVK